MTTTISLFRHTRDIVSFLEGEIIFAAGQSGELMYIVVEGEVEIHHGERLLSVVRAGEPFGEMALIDRSVRSATAIARTDCILAPINETRFTYMVQETPIFALQVMRVLVERLRLAQALD